MMAVLVVAGLAALGLGGCATMPRDQGPTIERTLARAEFALEAAEMALAMWDAQAVAHPEIDRWPEERAKLAEAVREARKVVEMLQAVREGMTGGERTGPVGAGARLEPGDPRGARAGASAGT
jgi:hypothetical protein